MTIKAKLYKRVTGFTVANIGIVMTMMAGSVIADSVEDMCRKPGEICSCSAERLKSEVGDDDYALYEAVGAAYIANQATGMKMGDAWDAAVRAESGRRGLGFSETLTRTNATGKAHRKAIKDCTH